MTLNSKRAKVPDSDIEQVINAGGSISKKDDSNIENSNLNNRSDIRFTVSMPVELADIVDKLRRPTKTSRQAWLLQAAHEKLEREGKL